MRNPVLGVNDVKKSLAARGLPPGDRINWCMLRAADPKLFNACFSRLKKVPFGSRPSWVGRCLGLGAVKSSLHTQKGGGLPNG